MLSNLRKQFSTSSSFNRQSDEFTESYDPRRLQQDCKTLHDSSSRFVETYNYFRHCENIYQCIANGTLGRVRKQLQKQSKNLESMMFKPDSCIFTDSTSFNERDEGTLSQLKRLKRHSELLSFSHFDPARPASHAKMIQHAVMGGKLDLCPDALDRSTMIDPTSIAYEDGLFHDDHRVSPWQTLQGDCLSYLGQPQHAVLTDDHASSTCETCMTKRESLSNLAEQAQSLDFPLSYSPEGIESDSTANGPLEQFVDLSQYMSDDGVPTIAELLMFVTVANHQNTMPHTYQDLTAHLEQHRVGHALQEACTEYHKASRGVPEDSQEGSIDRIRQLSDTLTTESRWFQPGTDFSHADDRLALEQYGTFFLEWCADKKMISVPTRSQKLEDTENQPRFQRLYRRAKECEGEDITSERPTE